MKRSWETTLIRVVASSSHWDTVIYLCTTKLFHSGTKGRQEVLPKILFEWPSAPSRGKHGRQVLFIVRPPVWLSRLRTWFRLNHMHNFMLSIPTCWWLEFTFELYRYLSLSPTRPRPPLRARGRRTEIENVQCVTLRRPSALHLGHRIFEEPQLCIFTLLSTQFRLHPHGGYLSSAR